MKPSATLTLAATKCRPFEELQGHVEWQLERPPKSLELRLFWFTSGRGTAESGVIAVKQLPLTAAGTESFTFTLPDRPYSFSGSLITVAWAVELAGDPGGSLALQEFVMAPGGEELRLRKIAKPRSGNWMQKGFRWKA